MKLPIYIRESKKTGEWGLGTPPSLTVNVVGETAKLTMTELISISAYYCVFMNSSRETFITPQRPLNDISSVTDIDES